MGWVTKNVRDVLSVAPAEGGRVDQWLARFIPRELVEDDLRSRARAFLLMRFTLVAAVFTILFAPYYVLHLKLPYVGLTNLAYGASLIATPVILRSTRSVRIAANCNK